VASPTIRLVVSGPSITAISPNPPRSVTFVIFFTKDSGGGWPLKKRRYWSSMLRPAYNAIRPSASDPLWAESTEREPPAAGAERISHREPRGLERHRRPSTLREDRRGPPRGFGRSEPAPSLRDRVLRGHWPESHPSLGQRRRSRSGYPERRRDRCGSLVHHASVFSRGPSLHRRSPGRAMGAALRHALRHWGRPGRAARAERLGARDRPVQIVEVVPSGHLVEPLVGLGDGAIDDVELVIHPASVRPGCRPSPGAKVPSQEYQRPGHWRSSSTHRFGSTDGWSCQPAASAMGDRCERSQSPARRDTSCRAPGSSKRWVAPGTTASRLSQRSRFCA
jgi:hypothetical protein